MSAPEAISSGPTLALRAALGLPLLASGLLAAAGLLMIRRWQTRPWGRLACVYSLLVLLAGGGYLWLLESWNLLGFHFL